MTNKPTVPGLFKALDAYIHDYEDGDGPPVIETVAGTARRLGNSPLYAHRLWMGCWVIWVNLGAPDLNGIVMVDENDQVRTEF